MKDKKQGAALFFITGGKMKKRKLIAIFFLLFSMNISCLYAASKNEETKLKAAQPETEVENSLKKILGTIVTVTGSIYIKILALSSLIYIATKLIITQDKREFLKKVYGWILACFLVSLTPSIVNKVMQIKDNMKQLQTFSLIDTPSFSEAKKKN